MYNESIECIMCLESLFDQIIQVTYDKFSTWTLQMSLSRKMMSKFCNAFLHVRSGFNTQCILLNLLKHTQNIVYDMD